MQLLCGRPHWGVLVRNKMTYSEKKISNIIFEKDSANIFFDGLDDDEYGFINGMDFIKEIPTVKYEKGVPCLGFGYGGFQFNLYNIDFWFYYDEMLGLWLETKDINEKSAEAQKEKILNFAQEILNVIIEEEKKYSPAKKESEIFMRYTIAELGSKKISKNNIENTNELNHHKYIDSKNGEKKKALWEKLFNFFVKIKHMFII